MERKVVASLYCLRNFYTHPVKNPNYQDYFPALCIHVTQKPRLTADERNWHGSCITLGIAPDVPARHTKEGLTIMSRFNFDAVRSLALAGFASVYASLMLVSLIGAKGAEIGSLVI
jgi:hypothetical protein